MFSLNTSHSLVAQLKSRKLSGVPIDFRFLLTEIRRCCNSLAFLALWDVFLVRSGAVCGDPGAVIDPRQSLLFTLPLTLLWADLHFYAVHRFLHSHPLLYKHVHKIHHESVNTNIMSGLSFHPVEGFLYFSSLLFCLLLPGGMRCEECEGRSDEATKRCEYPS